MLPNSQRLDRYCQRVFESFRTVLSFDSYTKMKYSVQVVFVQNFVVKEEQQLNCSLVGIYFFHVVSIFNCSKPIQHNNKLIYNKHFGVKMVFV